MGDDGHVITALHPFAIWCERVIWRIGDTWKR
jgi:hypothetical protein